MLAQFGNYMWRSVLHPDNVVVPQLLHHSWPLGLLKSMASRDNISGSRAKTWTLSLLSAWLYRPLLLCHTHNSKPLKADLRFQPVKTWKFPALQRAIFKAIGLHMTTLPENHGLKFRGQRLRMRRGTRAQNTAYSHAPVNQRLRKPTSRSNASATSSGVWCCTVTTTENQ